MIQIGAVTLKSKLKPEVALDQIRELEN